MENLEKVWCIYLILVSNNSLIIATVSSSSSSIAEKIITCRTEHWQTFRTTSGLHIVWHLLVKLLGLPVILTGLRLFKCTQYLTRLARHVYKWTCRIFSFKSSLTFNPLHPIISMHILLTVCYKFPEVPTRRICKVTASLGDDHFLPSWNITL